MAETIRLVIEMTFDGDYYHPDELTDVASGWLRNALYDRDDLVESSIVISEDHPEIHTVEVGTPHGRVIIGVEEHRSPEYLTVAVSRELATAVDADLLGSSISEAIKKVVSGS